MRCLPRDFSRSSKEQEWIQEYAITRAFELMVFDGVNQIKYVEESGTLTLCQYNLLSDMNDIKNKPFSVSKMYYITDPGD